MGAIRKENLLFTCAADLERNRLVTLTKSTGAVAYTTYGGVADGWLPSRAENLRANVVPMDQLYGNMRLKLQTGVTKGAPLFAGANGQVLGTVDHTVISRTQPYDQPAGTAGDKYLVPADVTTWDSPEQAVAGQIAVKGASAWTLTDATAGMVVLVTDEARYYVCSAANTWVLAKIIGYAAETGVAGEEVEVYQMQTPSRIASEALPANMNYGIMATGLITVSAAETSGTLVDDRIAVGDIALATVVSASGTAPGTVKTVVTANTVTCTITAPGGSDTTVIRVVVIKQLA